MIVSLYIYVEKVGNYFPLVVEEPKGGGGGGCWRKLVIYESLDLLSIFNSFIIFPYCLLIHQQ